MSSPETDFEPVSCRMCGCTEDAACPEGCCWVADPAQGDLCSACLVRVHEALGRLLLGLGDQVDLELVARFAEVELPPMDPRRISLVPRPLLPTLVDLSAA